MNETKWKHEGVGKMLTELFELQREVDRIIENKIDVNFNDTLNERKIAFKVELSEFANEIGFFKYWKKSHVKNDERIKDEWSDCLAFLLSITNSIISDKKEFERINNKYIMVGCSLSLEFLYNQLHYNKLKCFIDLYDCFITLYKIGVKLGYNVDELNEAYRNKSKENIRRAKEGY